MIREKSYMLAIPAVEEDVEDLNSIIKRLEKSDKFEVLNMDYRDDGVYIKVEYREIEYDVEFYPISDFEINPLFRMTHLFEDIDADGINNSRLGVGVDMFFSDNSLESYHLQLKIIDTILPDKLGVIDYSSEKVLSGKWVSIAASSNVPPAPKYIYTVQAVCSESDEVWLHSHGLNRCNITELEVLNSTKDSYQTHYNIIETMANRLLELDSDFKEKEPMYLARLSENIHLITTIVSWEEAVRLYDENLIGGKLDRENGHNKNTSVIFSYPSSEDYRNKDYKPIYIYDDILSGNPLYILTQKETNRMKSLAIERIEYVDRAFREGSNGILLKIALKVDDEYKDEMNSYEHIWFELKDMDIYNDVFVGELTQKPYYIKGIGEGYIGKYKLKDITDWMIFSNGRRLSPDDVYLIDRK